MTREINGRIVMRVSDDGTRCAAECPHAMLYGDQIVAGCRRFGPFDYVVGVRHKDCIAAEQAAASVPSCEGARGLDASEALREARVQGMREGHEIACRWLDDVKRVVSGEALGRAIEAVRKGER